MTIDHSNAKRVGIFFVYDKEGIIDDYIIVLLNSLKSNLTRLIVVVNGILGPSGRKKLSVLTNEIIVRENVGYDSWAYKTGLEYIGWENLMEYDEMIMFNFTIMGPVNSFDDMFEEMDSQDLDFWGITKYYGVPWDPFGCIKYGYLPDYLQSHFIAIRKTMFSDNAFIRYWSELPPINSYGEAVGKHEAIFTKTFADIGFTWDSYVKTDDIKKHDTYPIMFNTIELVKNRKCPIFKRRMFIHDYDNVLRNSLGNMPSEFIAFLKQYDLYDVNLIVDNILRTGHQEDFVRNLNLNYVLSSHDSKAVDRGAVHTVMVIHIYYSDMIELMLNYAEYMPEDADIYITVVNSSTYDEVAEKLALRESLKGRTDIRIIENRGRDVSSVLVGVKDVIMNYDIACFIHDKKTPQMSFASIGEGFANICYGNIVYSKDYVNNVIRLFYENKRLGIAVNPYPVHADFFGGLGNEWTQSYEVTQELYQKLKLTVPISRDKKVIAPYGTCFWFRPQAMKILYDQEWDYDDFPKEPNKYDGTILHAVERIYPLVVQQNGYYPAIIMSDYYAGLEYAELEYYLRHYNKKIFEKFGADYFDRELIKISQIQSDDMGGYVKEKIPEEQESQKKDSTPAGPTWKRTIYWILFDHEMLKWKIRHKFEKKEA
jgi:rhamnosyltransferase